MADLKAFIVNYVNGDYVSLVHAETRGKAKKRFDQFYCEGDFIDIRTRRIPELDNVPFTFENADKAGFHFIDGYDDDGNEIICNDFWCECNCVICRGELNKSDSPEVDSCN